jgi:hypothetical protein
MSRWAKRAAWAAAALPVLFLVAALLAPRFEADALREPLRLALGGLLGREVEVREVRYTLFPAIGVTAADLLIPDDPEFGLEPVAYVTELQAGIHWSSLFRRRLVFSSLRLVEASVNLSRNEAGEWNVGRLLAEVARRMEQQRQAPSLAMRSGRMNFRQGTLKSPYFLNTVDVDLRPPSAAGGPVEWSFECSPARTDRAEQGFGRFTGEGVWRDAGSPRGRIEMNIELERSQTSEVATLLAGGDLGLQGRMAARMRLDGPPDRLALKGRLEIEGFDRGGRFAPRGREWVMPFEGNADLDRQALELRSAAAAGAETPPLEAMLTVNALFTRPRVGAAFTLDGLPAAAFLDLARRLGVETPPGFSLTGTLHGALAMPEAGPLSGEVELREAEVRLGEAGPVSIAAARVRLRDGAVELSPSQLTTPSGAQAELEGRWTAGTGALSFRAKFPALPLDELNTALVQLPASAAPEPLRACREGVLGGDLRYESAPEAGAGRWAGELLLQDVLCEGAGWGAPVRLLRAPVTVRGAQWAMKNASVRWGRREAALSVEAGGAGLRPLRLWAQAPELDAGDLEALLRPAVERRGSFLERTLRRAPPPPAWLRARSLQAELRVKEFTLAGEECQRLAVRAFWDGDRIEAPLVELRQGAASFSGRASVQLRAGAPVYHVQGRLEQYPLAGAPVDATLDLQAAGLGRGLLERLQAEGRLDARRVPAGAGRLDWFAACYDYDAARPAPARLRLNCLEASAGGEYFTANPMASGLERVAIELSSPRRSVTLLWPATP